MIIIVLKNKKEKKREERSNTKKFFFYDLFIIGYFITKMCVDFFMFTIVWMACDESGQMFD